MSSVPRLAARDAAAVAADVLLPLLARGPIVRRRRVEDLLDRADADRRAVRRLQRLRRRYGDGPVLLRLPRRDVALVLAPAHVRRVLAETPEPFAPANLEKRAALSHFQPHGVLISTGSAREERRRFNEEVLDSGATVHRLARELLEKVAEEAGALARDLGWDEFAPAWWRIVRRIVLGDSARDDHDVTDLLAALRRDANWAYLKPKRPALRERLFRQLDAYVARAEPGSLASLVAPQPATRPLDQMAHWLFAFDAAGMATFRALALLAAHPDQGDLRACVLESIRLWPTTPAILRDATAETSWENGTLPAGAAVLVFAPFFHRDAERLPHADGFHPELWLGGEAAEPPLVPFSAGPAACPGRNLVLLTTSSLLGRIVEAGPVHQAAPAGLGAGPLPATLSPFRLRFRLAPGR